MPRLNPRSYVIGSSRLPHIHNSAMISICPSFSNISIISSINIPRRDSMVDWWRLSSE